MSDDQGSVLADLKARLDNEVAGQYWFTAPKSTVQLALMEADRTKADLEQEVKRLREALQAAIGAWDQLYRETMCDQFPFAEDLEFGAMSRARSVLESSHVQ